MYRCSNPHCSWLWENKIWTSHANKTKPLGTWLWCASPLNPPPPSSSSCPHRLPVTYKFESEIGDLMLNLQNLIGTVLFRFHWLISGYLYRVGISFLHVIHIYIGHRVVCVTVRDSVCIQDIWLAVISVCLTWEDVPHLGMSPTGSLLYYALKHSACLSVSLWLATIYIYKRSTRIFPPSCLWDDRE